MRSDIEIAQSTTLLPIDRVARKLGLGEEELERNGQYMAKLRLPREKRKQRGKLILVTAINPTQAGEGKTTTSIGLADAMNRLGERERHIIDLRFYEGKTQREVADEIRISQAEVSRLEKHALRSMRNYLRN